MTTKANNISQNKHSPQNMALSLFKGSKLPFVTAVLGFIILHFSDIARIGAYNGIMLCINTVIPSLFPFMVLSDLALWIIDDDIGGIGVIFERMLGIRKRGAPAYISGALCGYPVGVSGAVSLRRSGLISREEANVLMPLSANPSLAFVTVGVGGGVFKNIGTGIIMYTVIIISGLLTGVIFREKSTLTYLNDRINKEKFDFSASIISSGKKMLMISAFVVFFSSVGEILNSVVESPRLSSALFALTEISSGVFRLCDGSTFGIGHTAQILCTVALSFGGLSILLQAMSIKKGSDISIVKYIKFKCAAAVISAILISAVLMIKRFAF